MNEILRIKEHQGQDWQSQHSLVWYEVWSRSADGSVQRTVYHDRLPSELTAQESTDVAEKQHQN